MKDYENETKVRGGLFASLRDNLANQISIRKERPSVLIADFGALIIGFLFARCHVVFGARPLAIGLLALLPTRVFTTLIGCALGALSLGGGGSIYAIIYTLLTALRIILSGNTESEVFGENLLTRICEATIGGFLAGTYQGLLTGISTTSVLFGLSMVIIPPIVTFALSGIFDTDTAFDDFLCGSAELMSLKGKSEREKYALIFFQCSLLLFSLFISMSLMEFELFGFSFSYIFVSIAVLFCARRFGPIRAAAVGFVSSLPISAIYSVAFALSGLASGALFSFGIAFGIGAGAVALLCWSAYTGGAMGILATLPEYAVGAAVIAPFVKKRLQKESEEAPVSPSENAEEMVCTMALAYQNKSSGALDSLEEALVGISSAAKSFDGKDTVREEEYRSLVESTADGYDAFGAERVKRLFIEKSAIIARRLKRGEDFTAAMLGVSDSESVYAEELAAMIMQRAVRLEEDRYKQRLTSDGYEDYRLIAKLINEARSAEERERCNDTELSTSLEAIFAERGFSGGVIKVFGERRRHIIAAGDDPDGTLITSKELRGEIERLANVSLGETEYFRKGRTVLMETEAVPRYSVEYASATMAGSSAEVSGDVAEGFSTESDYFYSLISDGMGSGELAKETSEFVVRFLRCALCLGFSETVLHVLNHVIRQRGEECSATVDLFELDTITGDATFIKSGAAPSYVKREGSIFRIRSETAPIGLMKSIDAERVRVEIKDGDYIVMLSDGVSSTPEDAPWLLELLAEAPKRNIKEYAEYILSAAVKSSRTGDDMTVAVAKVKKISD